MNEAVINDMTVRELKKMWLYKYSYDIEIDEKSEQTYFSHRRADLCQSIANLCKFIRGKSSIRSSWNSPRTTTTARGGQPTKSGEAEFDE